MSPGTICNLLSRAYAVYICPLKPGDVMGKDSSGQKKWQVMPGKTHRLHLPKGSGRETTAYELLAIK